MSSQINNNCEINKQQLLDEIDNIIIKNQIRDILKSISIFLPSREIEKSHVFILKYEPKYVIQNKTLEQNEFIIKFLTFYQSINPTLKGVLKFNNKKIPYLETKYGRIRCSLYKNNIIYIQDKSMYYINNYRDIFSQNTKFIVTLKFNKFIDSKIDIDIPCLIHKIFHPDRNIIRMGKIMSYKRLAFSYEYVSTIISIFYSKEEFKKTLNDFILNQDILNIVFDYTSLIKKILK